MNPTDTYYKTKKTFLLFVGGLLLAIFAGFRISNGEQKITFLPFQLERPELLGTILFILVIFYLFQLSLQWAAQHADVQVNKFHRIDFISTATIGTISILCYLGAIVAPYILFFAQLAGHSAVSISKGSAWLGAVLGVIISLAASFALSRYSIVFGRKIKAMVASEEVVLARVLESGIWSLHFDPSQPDARKQITFLDNGSIGLGRNKNESRWRINQGLLEILNSNDQIFSRFAYEPTTQVFLHTNDEDTRSIKSQTISRRTD